MPEYDLGAVHELLTSAFDPGELRRFCRDHSAFRPILSRVPANASLDDMADTVIRFCERNLLFDELVGDICQVNPRQYDRFKDRLHRGRSLNGKLSVPKLCGTKGVDGTTQLSSMGNEAAPNPSLELDPRYPRESAVPSGAVTLDDPFYIERKADKQLKEEIGKWGTTTTIRAPRQTGKTSLLMRGLHYARKQGASTVFLDVQGIGSEQLASLNLFLRALAETICDELDMDEAVLEDCWSDAGSTPMKLRRLMERYILPASDKLFILAVDEADGLLHTDFYQDFFSMLRSWHNRRAHPQRRIWRGFNMVLVISTEPSLIIRDPYSSPFNVGLHLDLPDFDQDRVRDLSSRYGSPIAEGNLPDLMDLLHGHPFLTRWAMYTLVVEDITWPELARDAHMDYGPFGRHLKHQYWLIHDKPELRKALKEIIRIGRCFDDGAIFRLLKAGLVRGSGDIFTCRCNLYRLYFEDKLF